MSIDLCKIGCRTIRWIVVMICVFTPGSLPQPVRAQSHPAAIVKNGPGSAEFSNTLQDAAAAEGKSLNELKDRLNQLQMVEKATSTEVNAYKIQISAHGNLLLLSSAGLKELEKAAGDNRMAINAVNERLKDLQKRRDSIQALQQQAAEQLRLGESQRVEIKAGRWTKNDAHALTDALGKLLKLVAEKQAVLKGIYEKQSTIIDALSGISLSLNQLAERLDQQITSRTKAELFERKILSLKSFDGSVILSEFAALANGMRRFFDGRFWTEEGLRAKESGTMPLLTLGVLVLVGTIVIFRLRGYCKTLEQMPSMARYRWRRLGLILIRRSVVFLGAAGVLYGYDTIQFPHFKLPVVRLLLNLILIGVLSRWILDSLNLWDPADPQRFPPTAKSRVRSLAIALRWYAIVYLLTVWSVNPGSMILYALRLVLEIGLTIWCYRFWRAFRGAEQAVTVGVSAFSFLQSVALCTSYLIAVGGLIIELTGYPTLTIYWYVSWAKTLVVLLWLILSFMVIREWQQAHRSAFQAEGGSHPIQLLLIQAAWLIWVMCVLDGLVLAWSTNWEVFQAVYGFMSRPWTIGKINLSIVGLIYAVIILFLTYTLSRLGRYLLAEKILHESTMEPGLRSSITSIYVYLMWALGIVLALGVLGVDTTSLAVIFGALSIGIGFGLQNIFNNFISGIILLFERPIQVGDAVEIGGIWGEVKKINVRATVVQTFDNASLIIPNSEFISNQVTNWSFKDQSLRRKINVGVAYGSDVELVRKTLLEIANRTPNVLGTPPPDVHFMDHGDSALIFMLRYWTTIDYYYTTSTDIRFELDRRFRELGIEIAFPQRDIHIRSVVKKTDIAIGNAGKAEREEAE